MAEERKVVTVLFADMVSSTAIGEQLDPEQLRALLQRYFRQMSATIESRGGIVEKYIGDAVMAVFGVPTVREDDAERAVDAALEMLRRVDQLAPQERERYGVELAIRIGINTGEVLVPVGDALADLVVTGDAVNTAARLQQAAAPGAILVGERTWGAALAAFDFEPPVRLELKGKREPVAAYAVRGRTAARRPRGIPGLSAPMIGRDRELGLLATALTDALETREPRTALVIGSAGIGKSRLVREAIVLARDAYGDVSVVEGRCVPAGEGITYWALNEILRSVAGMTLDDGAETATGKLTTAARALLARLPIAMAEVEHTIFALALTAGIHLPDNPLERVPPAAVAEELAIAWPRFLSALAAHGPLIVVIEDLHWAGDPLLRMLARIGTRADGPMLIVGTARPEVLERTGTLMPGAEALTLSLRPLADRQSATLVDSLLAEAELPASLRSEIVERAEGNPFFLEEILRRLIDEGGLVREDGRWRATATAPRVALPDTVQALLAARIDALQPDEKTVLQQASVVGRGFWEGSLAALDGRDAAASRVVLTRLEEKGLIFVRPVSTLQGEREYAFRHALVREVAYASLPKAQRARLHARVGRWLDELAHDRRDEVAELVGYHLRAAVAGDGAEMAWIDDDDGREEIRRAAVEALLRAGAGARRRSAVAKALELDSQALELAVGDRERMDALAAIGDDHDAAFHGDEAVASYLRALDAARGEADVAEQRARILLRMSHLAAVRWGGFRDVPHPAASDGWVDEALATTRDVERRGWLLATRAAVAARWATVREPDPVPVEQRIAAGREALEVALRLDLPDLTTLARRALGTALFLAGDYDGAVAVAQQELAAVERVVFVQERAFSLFWNAHVLSDVRARYVDALASARESHRLARDLSAHDRMHGTFSLMDALFHLGSWREIPALLDAHVAERTAEPGIACPFALGGPLIGATALARMGDIRRADEVAASFTAREGREGLPEALLARYLVASGRPADGLALAMGMIDGGRVPTIEEPGIDVLAALEALEALGDHERLASFLPTVRRTVRQITLLGPTADRAEGRMLAARGDAHGAELLRRAIEGFDALGVAVEAAAAREALAGVEDLPADEANRLRAEADAAFVAAGIVSAVPR